MKTSFKKTTVLALRILATGALACAGNWLAWADNPPPSITITNPADGSYLAAPATVVLQSSASQPLGSITKVEYFSGPAKLATATTPPYEFVIPDVPTGTYSFYAVATDNSGNTGNSTPIAFTVETGPQVTFLLPTNNSGFYSPATIKLVADVGTTDAPIAKVDFYQTSPGTGQLLDTVVREPYELQLGELPAGNYSFAVIVHDTHGLSSTANVTNISVASNSFALPTVQIVSPATNTAYLAGTSFTVTAHATNGSASVASTTLFRLDQNGGVITYVPLADAPGDTVSYTFTNASPQISTLAARASDAFGGTSESATVRVAVYEPIHLQTPILRPDGTVEIQFTGSFVAIDVSNDLKTWSPVGVTFGDSGLQWIDTGATNQPLRFYRGRAVFDN